MGLRQKIRLRLGCESRLVPSSPDTPNPKPQTRFSRARRGSVLILVIVLLLMLAILGAAYISTSRGERTSSSQLATNNQIDQHALNIAQAVMGTIIADTADFAGYTHGEPKGNPAVNYPTFTYTNPSNVTATYNLYHSTYVGQYPPAPATTSDPIYTAGDIVSTNAVPPVYWRCVDPVAANQNLAGGSTMPLSIATGWQQVGAPGITSGYSQYWLASRAPELIGTPPTYIGWPNITQTFIPGQGPYSILANQLNTTSGGAPLSDFESPDGTPAPWGMGAGSTPLTNMYPGYKALANGVLVPTLDQVAPAAGSPGIFIAADADGDGVADSLLFRIPGAAFDNLTWYAAVRIIDNNSAINANTALSSVNQFDISTAPFNAVNPSPDFWGLFPASVGLEEILGATATGNPLTTDFARLTNYRFNYESTLSTTAQPLDETGLTPPYYYSATPPPPSNPPYYRSDFTFISEGDYLNQQMARRLQNPGLIAQTPPAGVNSQYLRFNVLPWSDTAALAYHFGLVNSNLLGQTDYPTLTENLLGFSVYNNGTNSYRSTPYNGTGGNDITAWYNNNFNVGATNGITSGATPGLPNYQAATPETGIRQFLVTRNPVSNYITPVYDSNPLSLIYTPWPPLTPPALQSNFVGEPLYTTPMGEANYVSPTPDPFGELMLPYGPYTDNTANPGVHNHYRGNWASATTPFFLNDIVLDNGYTYICVNTSPTGVPAPTTPIPATAHPSYMVAGTLQNSSNWQLQPFTTHPVKTNVNTATFRELFRAFWCVMSGDPTRSTTVQYKNGPYAPLSSFGDIQSNSAYATNMYNIYTPPGIPPETDLANQFRSPLRDPTSAVGTAGVTRMDAGNVAILRAAIAAVNTLGLRDNSQNVISRTVGLTAYIQGNTNPTTVHARVYSNTPQPFITEVFACNFSGDPTSGHGTELDYSANVPPLKNTNGYIAIELYNPYSFTMTLTNWQIGLIDRDPSIAVTGSNYPNLQFTSKATNAAYTPIVLPTLTIPPQGFAIIESYSPAGGGDSAYRPIAMFPSAAAAMTGTLATNNGVNGVTDTYVQGLIQAITLQSQELVLLRPRRADGVPTSNSDPFNSYTEYNTSTSTWNLSDLIPIDSYDFTGFPATSPAAITIWHYVRPKSLIDQFRATFPGLYNGSTTPRMTGTNTTGATPPGSAAAPIPPQTYPPAGSPYPPYVSNTIPLPVFGQPSQDPAGWDEVGSGANFPYPPIQIYNVADATGKGLIFSHFPNPMVCPFYGTGTPPPNAKVGTPVVTGISAYPFGGFARDGDILDVPFIGAYRITNPNTQSDIAPASFLELNSVTMDCAFAEDGDTTNEKIENIGRFCPLSASPQFTAGSSDHYFWARRLFDYLTTRNNTDNYLPNFDPGFNEPADLLMVTPPAAGLGSTKYPPNALSGTFFPGTPTAPAAPTWPTQVYNANGTVSDQTTQDSDGVDGLININTAPAQVLNMLPLVPSPAGQNNTLKNWQLAQAIVADREANGPFLSVLDLNRVKDLNTGLTFQNAEGTIQNTTANPDGGTPGAAGLLCPAPINLPSSPNVAAARNIAEDYQSDFAEVTRISNLVTTHSDTFTVYIVVEGWANAYPPGANPGPSANSPQPQLKVLHRYAFICDRSAISGAVGSFNLKTLVVPND